MRRALMILYYFPPAGGPGVQRGLKFARYLPEFGWEPLILTVPQSAAFPVRDPSLLEEIPPQLIVRRARCPEFYGIYRLLAGKRSGADVDLETQSGARRGLLARRLHALRASLFIPDGRAAWRPFAVRAGEALIHQAGAELIFSSGPPFTCHLIGRALRRRTGRPWVADYRDPWTQATFYPQRPAWARALDGRLEESCLREADATVVVGATLGADLRARAPAVPAERFTVIPNGYDEADFAGVESEPPGVLRLTHSGSLFGSRAPETLLAVLSDLIAAEEGFAAGVRLCLAGRIDAELRARVARPPLDRIVELPGYLPHAESIRLLRRSRVLLLLIAMDAQSRGMVTGKIFEYLAAGAPILALGPKDGDAAQLLAETGAGWMLAPDDARGLRALLLRLWREHRAEGARIAGRPAAAAAQAPATAPAAGQAGAAALRFGLRRDEGEIARYSRRALTHRLAALFDRLVT